MSARRCWFFFFFFPIVVFFIPACGGDPPNAEMGQAETAIAAVRDAGAASYAPDELAAAQRALTSARLAVEARDYRLALNDALDARDRAATAAKAAAGHKAAARANADRALRDAAVALTAESARRPASVLAGVRQAIARSEHLVQEARATFERGDYLDISRSLAEPTALLRDSRSALESAAAAKVKQRRR